jgi:putative ABC transport system substrate-binding protein
LSGREAPTSPSSSTDSFRQGLRDLGYTEGKNILIEYHHPEGRLDRVPGIVAELVQRNVDILVLVPLPAIGAAKQATKTIPIVMVATVDPVATGIIDSLAHPGGNITGLTTLSRDLSGKRLELLTEVVPKISRVGVLWEAAAPAAAISFKEYEAAARTLNIQLQCLELEGLNPDLDKAFRAAAKGQTNALIGVRSILVARSLTKRIAELAIKIGCL